MANGELRRLSDQTDLYEYLSARRKVLDDMRRHNKAMARVLEGSDEDEYKQEPLPNF